MVDGVDGELRFEALGLRRTKARIEVEFKIRFSIL
jgi:hypothetical protein